MKLHLDDLVWRPSVEQYSRKNEEKKAVRYVLVISVR